MLAFLDNMQDPKNYVRFQRGRYTPSSATDREHGASA